MAINEFDVAKVAKMVSETQFRLTKTNVDALISTVKTEDKENEETTEEPDGE